jgi:hypothetical protein
MTAFRLHLVSNVKVADNFAELFVTLQDRAQVLVDAGGLTDAAAWELAQYVDLADAGHGSRRSVLYRRVVSCLAAYVRQNLARPATRGMFNRSATLSQMVNETLDERAVEETNCDVVVLAA